MRGAGSVVGVSSERGCVVWEGFGLNEGREPREMDARERAWRCFNPETLKIYHCGCFSVIEAPLTRASTYQA